MTATGGENAGGDLRNLPAVPSSGRDVTAADYGIVPVDRGSPLYGEDLVELQDYAIAGVSYYHIADGSNPPFHQRLEGSLPRLLARRSVAERLVSVNRQLERAGLELFVWDAFRPIATQRGIWRFFERAVRRASPDLSDNAVRAEVIRFVSDPNGFDRDDSTTWPTHMTGASVDLTLRHRRDGQLLDMGAHFDQMDESACSDHFETLLARGQIDADDPRLLNRRLLHFVMAEAGFTNYPPEFWHFDWGNQMYQLMRSVRSGAPVAAAVYGIAPGAATA